MDVCVGVPGTVVDSPCRRLISIAVQLADFARARVMATSHSYIQQPGGRFATSRNERRSIPEDGDFMAALNGWRHGGGRGGGSKTSHKQGWAVTARGASRAAMLAGA